MSGSQPAFLSGIEQVARTDVGMRRANNQDAHAVRLAEDLDAYRDRGHLFLVADGMGAHAAGEKASYLAAAGIPHLYRHYRDEPAMLALGRAIAETNREIHRQGQANPEFHAMGTTASVLVIGPEGAILGHVGDSRIYRLREETLEQLTFDHSLQWELKALGRFQEQSELAQSVPKNVITRSLGPGAEVEVDLEGPYPLQTGDTFLLCSDGLSGTVEDEEIGAFLSCLTPAEAAEVLVDLANLRGGPDNITAVIVKVLDAEPLDGGGPSVKSATKRQKTPPQALAAWVVAAVCLLLTGLLFWAELAGPAAVSAVAFLAAAICGAVFFFRGQGLEATRPPVAERAGKGPYSSVACKSRRKSVEMLRGVLAELRQAAEELGWDLRWERFGECERRVEQAAREGDDDAAIRGCTEAITSTMRQLREAADDVSADGSSGGGPPA